MSHVVDLVRRIILLAYNWKSFLQVFRCCGVLGPEVRGVQQNSLPLADKCGDEAEVGFLGRFKGERVLLLFYDDKSSCMNVVDEGKQQEGELCDCSHPALRSACECDANT